MIQIYSTPSCPYCHLAKEFFQENNIAFEDFNVAADEKALEEMVNKSGQMGVPVIDIDGEIVVGFNRAEIERILKEKGIKRD
ncbi:MAG TPA: glutaredoxin domain-containing protein [Candidatus Paceibacterota bacterium]|nr:glutaredoxin domain-containing protein [Candidatus Paceibacterota bacterium]HOV88994.1 glutaredoxin domain-containing protein [Candidatus Paceibacterota bacterium]HPP17253.1 glutaredoxin domain-containing protein [Candidatus Paceibacterota bacterium]